MNRVLLNGEWKLKKQGEDLCVVLVPGSVISGLYAAGKIPHPYAGENEYAIRDLFWEDYEFVRTFEVTKEVLAAKRCELICESLDTLTEITVNGKLLARTDNMHRTYRFSVEGYLKEGTNEIRILFRSVLNYIKEYQPPKHKPDSATIENCVPGNQWVRKAHSMLGWDWGPQTVDAGILRDIYLAYTSTPEIEDVRIRQTHENGMVRVSAEVTLSEELSDGEEAEVTLSERNGAWCRKVSAKKEHNCCYKAEIMVEEPKLWWPNGYGEQPLYELLAKTPYSEEKKTIGLRTITVSQEKDEWGEEFTFVVNGKKIFIMGGNYIPEDAVYPWIKKETIRTLLCDCKRINYNCIRVWGGGYYPSDYFYDLCDELGLIVWQDLMYACNLYTLTEEFEETCLQETVDNVRRLRHHASLGIWCGNNEVEWKWEEWDAFINASPHLRADYIRLFEYILPKALKAEDDQTFFWPSSPSCGGAFDDPNAYERGDTHYWDVWHAGKPFSDYEKHYFRFCSEFGFQSFPCLKTVETYAGKEEQNIFSPVMESHQKNGTANGKILDYISQNFRYPKDFASLLYISQVLQGMAIKFGVEHWRRNRGRCMGAIYWQVNDNWPVASWSSIDYYGRWKALHYMAKKFFAPVAVSIRKDGTRLGVWLANETENAVAVTTTALRMKRMDFSVLTEGKAGGAIVVAPYTSVCLLEQDVAEFMSCRDVFAEAKVTLENGTVLTETEVLVPYKHINLCRPEFAVEVCESETAYEIRLTGTTFAPFVGLDFADADAVFSDNFFSVSDEEPVIVRMDKTDIRGGSFADAGDVKKRLQITTVADTY